MCPLCERKVESTQHILMDCGKLTQIRIKIKSWLDIIKPNTIWDRSLILTGESIENEISRYILSEYKIAIWFVRNKVKFERYVLNDQEVINKVESNVRFYLNHVLNK